MIALENMQQVNKEAPKVPPVTAWNWSPAVKDVSAIDRSFVEASGGNTTSKNTYATQMDHGENR